MKLKKKEKKATPKHTLHTKKKTINYSCIRLYAWNHQVQMCIDEGMSKNKQKYLLGCILLARARLLLLPSKVFLNGLQE